jgi:hypothetical protein
MAEVAPPPIIDNLNDGSLLPLETPATTAAQNIPNSLGEPLTAKVALETAKTYTVLLNLIIGEIGSAIGKGEKSRYQLNQIESDNFSSVFGKMLFYNNMASMNPNIMFILTTIVIFAPKGRNILNDYRARKKSEAGANVPRGTIQKAATATEAAANVPRGTIDKNAATENANVPRGTIEEYIETVLLPNSKDEAMKIAEIKFGRSNFEIANEDNTPNRNKIYYARNVNNQRIKNNQHEAETITAEPSEYFKAFFMNCESRGMSAIEINAASKLLKNKIIKRYKISRNDINEAIAKHTI